MKIIKSLLLFATTLFVMQASAQNNPKGFIQGALLLPDGTKQNGFIKDNIRSNASVIFISAAGQTKKTYSANDLTGLELDGSKFVCVKGDFFKIIIEGDMYYMQKASDASGKLVYNGSEATVSAGTEGKPGDYFLFNNQTRELKWLSKKNLNDVTASSFAGSTSAQAKAKTASDPSQLKDAVETFNNRNK